MTFRWFCISAGAFVWLFQGLLGSLHSELRAANPDAGYTPLNSEPPRGSPLVPYSDICRHDPWGWSLLRTLGSRSFAPLSSVGACLDLGAPSTHSRHTI